MATYHFLGTTASLNDGNNWSLTPGGAPAGVVPGAADTIVFDNNSGLLCDVDVAGKTFANIHFSQPNASFVLDVTNDFTVTGNFNIILNSIGSIGINGGNINVGGNFTLGNGFGFDGSVTINLNGTGAWSGTAIVLASVDMSAGNISISGVVNYGGGTLTATPTLTTTGSTLVIVDGCTLDVSGVVWNDVILSGATYTITLASDFEYSGLMSWPNFLNATINGGVLNISDISIINAVVVGGTSPLKFIGGNISVAGASPQINSITIEFDCGATPITSSGGGNITFASNSTTDIFYTSGSVNLSGIGIVIGSVSGIDADLGPVVFGIFGSHGVINLISDILVVTLEPNNATINSGKISVSGTCSTTSNFSVNGNGEIVMIGTGTLSSSGVVGSYNLNVTINSSGTVTIGSVFRKGGSTELKYVAGSVDTTTNNSTLEITGSCTINTDGMTWNNITSNTGVQTVTLSSKLACSGNYINATTAIFTGPHTFTVGGSFTTGTFTASGGSSVILTGTGTWGGTSFTGTLIINTAGTVTLAASTSQFAGTWIYTSGAVNATGSTVQVLSTATFAASGMSFGNMRFSGGDPTLLQDLNVGGNFTADTATVTTTGAFNINVSGNLAVTTTLSGASTIKLVGSGTWTGASNNYINCPLVIDTTGNIVVSGTVCQAGPGAFTYVKGNVDTTGSTLMNNGGGTWDLNGIMWNNFRTQQSTLAFLSNFSYKGTCIVDNVQIWNGADVLCYGVSPNGTFAGLVVNGTSRFKFVGNNCSWVSNMFIRNKVEIDCDKITISGTIKKDIGDFMYTRGIVDAKNATLDLTSPFSMVLTNINKINFGAVTFAAGSIVMNKFFSGKGDVPCTISGSGILAVIVTDQSVSDFVYVKNVSLYSVSKSLAISTRDADKGGNSGITFMSEQGPRGLPDEEHYREHFGLPGFVNDWGTGVQGLVRHAAP